MASRSGGQCYIDPESVKSPKRTPAAGSSAGGLPSHELRDHGLGDDHPIERREGTWSRSARSGQETAPEAARRPGADFGAYARSVERLAELAPPPLKLLMAHNVAVSDPHFLAALRDAVHAIASGAAAGTRDSALVAYPFDGFSIQLPARRAPASQRNR